MDTNTPPPLGLSRRRILLGVGAVGIAAAGAGVGSLGYLADRERFRSTVAAGSLDLKLGYRTTYNGEVVAEAPGGDAGAVDCGTPGLVDGAGVPVVSLDDVKPGDCGTVTADLYVCANPSRLWLAVGLVAAAENDHRPEEVAAGDATPATGELGDVVEVTVWIDADGDGVVGDDERVLYEGTLAGLTTDAAGGLPVTVDDDGAPACVDGPDGPVPVALSWCLPLDGPDHNRAITDAVRFDLRFAAVQCRHDAVGLNPFETGPSTPENESGTAPIRSGRAALPGAEPGYGSYT
ncbi:hypothetical protein [Haloplanus halophilus]|uniref:hypothetical protein n=1 Tax=Haloplanus halophilus TaxID=2949993 RepID=UPI00203C843E|nr:hypothetical protein [Haloplanus sp. GDY1]